MKIKCGPTPAQRFERLQDWHRFFALWPLRIGPNDCRWLETVERKGKMNRGPMWGYWEWEYRALGK